MGRFCARGGGEERAVRCEMTDFYRGQTGVSWNLKPEPLFMAASEDLAVFREISSAAGGALFCQPVRIEGLSENVTYRVFAGETVLGTFTGGELAEGVDLSALEDYPQWEDAEQVDTWNRERHWKTVKYRNEWVEIGMQRAEYESGRIQRKYESWRDADQELRDSMAALAQEMAGREICISVVAQGYSVEDLEQEKERARLEAKEQARLEAQARARREAKERGRREACDRAGRRAQVRAGLEAKEQERRELLTGCAAAGIGLGICGLSVVYVRRRARLRGYGSEPGNEEEQSRKAG